MIGGVWDRTLVVIVFRFVAANESILISINHGPTLTHLQREVRKKNERVWKKPMKLSIESNLIIYILA